MIQRGAARRLICALRLADVGEGLQYRCVDGVGDWRRGHAESWSALGLSPAAILLHRLLCFASYCSPTHSVSILHCFGPSEGEPLEPELLASDRGSSRLEPQPSARHTDFAAAPPQKRPSNTQRSSTSSLQPRAVPAQFLGRKTARKSGKRRGTAKSPKSTPGTKPQDL